MDDDGYETGEQRIVYAPPVEIRASVSSARGTIDTEQFGNGFEYDKVIITDDINCQIDENTALFIDKLPEFDTEGNAVYDYIVRKVAKSLNNISYAISKVRPDEVRH